MTMPMTMAFGVSSFDHLTVLTVHGKESPSAAEWTQFCDLLGSMVKQSKGEIYRIRSLIVTDGGAPSAAQRDALHRLMAGQQPSGAIVTDNSLVRGAVTALSWFNPKTRAFAPRRPNDLIDFLRLSKAEIPALIGDLQGVSKALGPVPTLAAFCDALQAVR